MNDEIRAFCIAASTPNFEMMGKGHLNPAPKNFRNARRNQELFDYNCSGILRDMYGNGVGHTEVLYDC